MEPIRAGVVSLILVCGQGFAQHTQPENHYPDYTAQSSQTRVNNGDTPQKTGMEDVQRRLGEQERRKRMLADAQKLVSPSNELQAEVGRMAKDEAPVDLTRKAGEAEKIARELRKLNTE